MCDKGEKDSLGILSCGCIMCERCMNNTFRGHSGKTVGECPVCKHTVYKEQSRTKIGGMMLRNKVRQFPPVYNVSMLSLIHILTLPTKRIV